MGEAAQLTAIDSSVRFATFGFAKIFGSIGIGLAFIRMAKPEHRNAVKGMILPSVFVGAVAGITEPLDFSFLFISPFLWLVHGLITAVSETVLWVLGVRTYALYGLLDTLVCNSVISPQLTKIYLFFIVGTIMTGIWYLAFCFIIKRFDLQTPGRGSDFGLEIQEQGEPQKAGAQGYSVEDARRIIKGLGGVSNIESINNCFTRLRCEVREVNRIDQSLLKQTPQKGVVVNGSNVQVIIGLNVETVKDLVKQLWKEGE